MENNYLSAKEDKAKTDLERQLPYLSVEDREKAQAAIDELNKTSEERNLALSDACQNLSSDQCGSLREKLKIAGESYDGNLDKDDPYYHYLQSKYKDQYDGQKEITALEFDLAVKDVEAYREWKAQNLANEFDINIETARYLVLTERVSNTAMAIAASIVGPNSVKDKNLHLTNQQMQIIKDAEKVSTAKPGKQVTVPRDLNEQMFWKQVQENPTNGQILPGMNNDVRFPTEVGFQKMQATHKLPDGSSITIHYQYNSNTGKAYDMKIDSVQPKWPQPGISITDK